MARTGRPKSPPETHRDCHGETLELTDANFYRCPRGRNGWAKRCKGCMRIASRETSKLYRVNRTKSPPPLKDGAICDECFDLAHRRPWTGCARCGGSYAPESPIDIRDYLFRDYQRAV